MLSHDRTQSFPQEPILVTNPLTQQVLNVQPLLQLIHQRYGFDTDAVVQEFDDLVSYLTRDPQADEPARHVLACIRTAKAFLVAFDSCTLHTLQQV